MKLFVVLMLGSLVIGLVVALVIFPSLEAEVNRAQASAAYAEQQRLLAQAEVERARAATVTAKGEADALRMSFNQPIALLAIPMASLALVAVMVLILTFMRQGNQARVYRPQEPPTRIINVMIDGRLERLYVAEGQDPSMVVRHFLEAQAQRGLVVWMDG